MRMSTIRSYLGTDDFNWCQDIASIHLEYDVDENEASVEARIPSSTTRQGHCVISVRLRPNGSSILGSSCTCPIGYKCKHIYKVLCRIASSPQNPISGPDQRHRERLARRQRYADQMEHASVYIALHCKSEMDSGSDFRRSYYVKDNFDQEILGVFFSVTQANECAKDYCRDELGLDMDDDEDDEDDMEEDDDDAEPFVYDGSDDGECDEDNAFDKVWVECRAIEDASPQFHR